MHQEIDKKMSENRDIGSETRITAGARRMRSHRQRKRERLQCVTLDIREAEIDRLVAIGFLRREDRSDRNELLLALYRFLERSEIGDAHQ